MELTLFVAAGGGGDALAALMVGHALGRNGARPVVASFSWDRYLIDPEPGPRTIADFTGLNQLTLHAWEVTPQSRLRSGSTSGLALLASHSEARFILLDPSGGGAGLQEQLNELVQHFSADVVTLVDVGGDVVADGTEPTLSSPLADALALAALAELPIRTDVAVAGPGLDGELPEPYVRALLAAAGGDRHRLSASDAKGFLAALNHHPSEATTLLAASALGVSGQAEIRDSAALVSVSDASADFFVTTGESALGRNAVARRLIGTQTFDEAEAVVRDICGFTELDHERTKAHALAQSPQDEATADELRVRLTEYRTSAKSRGVNLGSFRRITEVIGRRRYDPTLIRFLAGELAFEDLPLCRF